MARLPPMIARAAGATNEVRGFVANVRARSMPVLAARIASGHGGHTDPRHRWPYHVIDGSQTTTRLRPVCLAS